MSATTKKILLGLGILIALIGYTWYEIANIPPASEAEMVGAVIPIEDIYNRKEIPVNPSKSQTIIDQMEREKQDRMKLEQVSSNNVGKIAADFDDIYSNPYKKKLNEIKNQEIHVNNTPTSQILKTPQKEYYSPKPQPTTNYNQPSVMKAKIYNNRGGELQEPKNNTTQNNESLFNISVFDKSSTVQNNNQPTENQTLTNGTIIKAAIMGQQQIKSGTMIRFRLLEEITINNIKFPRNTIFHGKSSFGNERLFVKVDKIPYQNSFVPVNMIMYDNDLTEGIYAPVKIATETATDEMMEGLEDVLSSSPSTINQITAGATRIARSVTNDAQLKITVHDSHQVLFMIVTNN